MLTEAQISKAVVNFNKAVDEYCLADISGKPIALRHKLLSEARVIRISLIRCLNYGCIHLAKLKFKSIFIWMRFNKRKD